MSKHCEMILVRADPTDCHRIDKRRSSGAWAGVARPRHPLSSIAQNHLRAQARQLGLGSAGCVSRRLGTASPFPATPSPSPVAWCPFPIPRSLRSSTRGTRGALRHRVPLLLRPVVGVKAGMVASRRSWACSSLSVWSPPFSCRGPEGSNCLNQRTSQRATNNAS